MLHGMQFLCVRGLARRWPLRAPARAARRTTTTHQQSLMCNVYMQR
tara:strand:- start:79 stop:216 length:138 start_codon:yes stop_codon:yes gene_type:complete